MPQATLTEYKPKRAAALQKHTTNRLAGHQRVNQLGVTDTVHHVTAAGVRDSVAIQAKEPQRPPQDVGFQNGVLLVLPGAAGCVAHRMLT